MHKMVNGKVVECTEEEIRAADQRRRLHDKRINSIDYQNEEIRRKRVKLYPKLGDQLDALLKHFEKMEADSPGTCAPELLSVVQNWRQVKTDNPLIEG